MMKRFTVLILIAIFVALPKHIFGKSMTINGIEYRNDIGDIPGKWFRIEGDKQFKVLENEFTIILKDNTSKEYINNHINAKVINKIGNRNIYAVYTDYDVMEILKEMQYDSEVSNISPSCLPESSTNDPLYDWESGMLHPYPHDETMTKGYGPWHHQNPEDQDIDTEKALIIEKGDPNVMVAIIDQGFMIDHPDLMCGGHSRIAYAKNYKDGYSDEDVYVGKKGVHGIYTSGTVCAVNDNGKGIASLGGGTNSSNGLRIAAYRASSNNEMVEALGDILDGPCADKIKIISLSIGGIYSPTSSYVNPSNSVCRLMKEAYEKGILITLCSRNGQDGKLSWNGQKHIIGPEHYDHLFVVGMTDRVKRNGSYIESRCARKRHFNSGWGPALNVVAPGGYVWCLFDSTIYVPYNKKCKEDLTGHCEYRNGWGTSISSPMTASLAGLVYSRFRSIITPDREGVELVKRIITHSCEKIKGSDLIVDEYGISDTVAQNCAYQYPGAPSVNEKYNYAYSHPDYGTWDPKVGYGRINAYYALAKPDAPPLVLDLGQSNGSPSLFWSPPEAPDVENYRVSRKVYDNSGKLINEESIYVKNTNYLDKTITKSSSGSFIAKYKIYSRDWSMQSSLASETIEVRCDGVIGRQVTQNETWGPGTVTVDRPVYVDGAKLTIRPGTRIKFTSQDAGIILRNNAELEAVGSQYGRITLDKDSNLYGRWEGLRFENVNGSLQKVDYMTIKNAKVGVETRSKQKNLYLRHMKISECKTGIKGVNSLWTRMEDSEISNCENGVFVTHPESGSNYFVLARTYVHDIDNIGVEFNTVHATYFVTAHIYNCGDIGLKAHLVGNLNLGSSSGVSDYATKIYKCGYKGDEHGSPAVYIYGPTYINRMEDVKIINNANGGLRLAKSITVNTSKTLHDYVSIGDNQLNHEGSTYELYVGSGSTYNVANRKYNIYNDVKEWKSRTPVYIYHALYNKIIYATNTWWGERVHSVSEAKNHCNIYYLIDHEEEINFGTLASAPYEDEIRPVSCSGSTALIESDEKAQRLDHAYAMIDTLGDTDADIEGAVNIFEALLSEGYAPAVYGLASALTMRGDSPEAIDQNLQDMVDVTDSFQTHAAAFLRGDVRMHKSDLSGAIGQYRNVAENAETLCDSLYALINANEAMRLQALLSEDDEEIMGKNGVVDVEGRVAKAEAKIKDLYRQLSHQQNADDGYKATCDNLPTAFELKNAYPNPFNPTTTVPFALPEDSHVNLSVYNVLGQRVVTLVDKEFTAGYHSVLWNGKNDQGTLLGSGVYFVKMEAGKYLNTQKIVLMK